MKSFVLAIRAIGTQLAMRLYVPAAIGVAAVMALIIVGAIWLTTLSEWWWLLFIPITILYCVVVGIAVILLLLIRFVRPYQTNAQKQEVKRFVDKLQGVVDVIGTPKIIILFRVIRSVAAPTKDSFLSDIVSNRELANDFKNIQQSFKSSL